jgi:hypothetical protein
MLRDSSTVLLVGFALSASGVALSVAFAEISSQSYVPPNPQPIPRETLNRRLPEVLSHLKNKALVVHGCSSCSLPSNTDPDHWIKDGVIHIVSTSGGVPAGFTGLVHRCPDEDLPVCDVYPCVLVFDNAGKLLFAGDRFRDFSTQVREAKRVSAR